MKLLQIQKYIGKKVLLTLSEHRDLSKGNKNTRRKRTLDS